MLMAQRYSEDERFIGLDSMDDAFVAMTSEGSAGIFSSDILDPKYHKYASKKYQTMKSRFGLMAFGGNDVDLHIYDLNKGFESLTFQAKNLKHDNLDLKCPISIMSIDFIDEKKIVTGTGYKQIRLYDTLAQRRPVKSFDVGDYPVKKIISVDENTLFFSDNVGNVKQFDLKQGRVTWALKGIAGAVTDMKVHENRLYTVGLDRFLRIFDLEARKLIQKVYLKQQLSGVLVTENVINDDNSDEEDLDDVWDKLPVITESRKKIKVSR
jgi:ribosome biogenesis protein NSA1